MEKNELDALLRELETIRSHVVIFKESYSHILKRAPKATKAHLIVFYQVFPYLENILKFVHTILPTINAMDEFIPDTTDKLPQAAKNLKKVTEATELATTEIMDLVEGVMNKLNQISSRDDSKEEIKNLVAESNDDLFNILNALQFQDITSQQIESIKSIIASVNNDMKKLISEFHDLKVENIEIDEKTFDTKAVFDREVAEKRQKEADKVFIEDSAGVENVITNENADYVDKSDESETIKKTVDTDTPSPDETEQIQDNDKGKEDSEKFSQDDIDSLFK